MVPGNVLASVHWQGNPNADGRARQAVICPCFFICVCEREMCVSIGQVSVLLKPLFGELFILLRHLLVYF